MSVAFRASRFNRFAKTSARLTGLPTTFMLAVVVVVAWAATGPIFNYSENWQLVINTGTTIVTFLMVFLIQNAQYRDSAAVQIKLDELIRAVEGAHNVLLDLEELDDRYLAKVQADYERLAEEARTRLKLGDRDTNVPDIALRQSE